MIEDFARMDTTLNPVEYLKTLRDSMERTDGYRERYKRFRRYLEEYHQDPYVWQVPEGVTSGLLQLDFNLLAEKHSQ